MPARRLITAAALVLAAALASPATGAAQGGAGPGELWEAFPLDPATTAPAAPAEASPPAAQAPAEPSAASPAPSGGDEDLAKILLIVVAVLVMAALVAIAATRRARGARAGTFVAPAPAEPPALPPPAAPPPAARPAPGPEPAALALARLSAEYLEVVASGSRRPVVDVADRRGWDIERTRRELGRARARGLLVGAGRGRAGGALSAEAERLLAPSAVPAPDDQPPARPGGVDRADLVVDETRRHADLADDVLRDIGGDAGGALGPRDPEPAVGANGRVGAR